MLAPTVQLYHVIRYDTGAGRGRPTWATRTGDRVSPTRAFFVSRDVWAQRDGLGCLSCGQAIHPGNHDYSSGAF